MIDDGALGWVKALFFKKVKLANKLFSSLDGMHD
jgi:hypothetical protein